MSLSRCSLCSLLALAAMVLVFCGHSQAVPLFNPRIYVLDTSIFTKKLLPVEGPPIGTNSAKGTFFLISRNRLPNGEIGYGGNFKVQEVSVEGTVLDAWELAPLDHRGIEEGYFSLSPNHSSLAYLSLKTVQNVQPVIPTPNLNDKAQGGTAIVWRGASTAEERKALIELGYTPLPIVGDPWR